jgi:4,5-DOPA dioxygenase extradiol
MNALETNRYTKAWTSFGASVPRPRAILVVSAHWFIRGTAVTAMTRPRTIHDFGGFPRELFAVEYPAPGDPGVAGEVAEALKPLKIGLDQESWGLDHGTWSVLIHAFPKADIPVLQLSIDGTKGPEFHFDLGKRLAPLRERGVLILGSGNVVHNLAAIAWNQKELGFDWAHRFDDAARAAMTTRPEDTQKLHEHADYARAVPTPDHFFPLLYIAGLAAAAEQPTSVLLDGYAMGSLSMTSYTLGL